MTSPTPNFTIQEAFVHINSTDTHDDLKDLGILTCDTQAWYITPCGDDIRQLGLTIHAARAYALAFRFGVVAEALPLIALLQCDVIRHDYKIAPIYAVDENRYRSDLIYEMSLIYRIAHALDKKQADLKTLCERYNVSLRHYVIYDALLSQMEQRLNTGSLFTWYKPHLHSVDELTLDAINTVLRLFIGVAYVKEFYTPRIRPMLEARTQEDTILSLSRSTAVDSREYNTTVLLCGSRLIVPRDSGPSKMVLKRATAYRPAELYVLRQVLPPQVWQTLVDRLYTPIDVDQWFDTVQLSPMDLDQTGSNLLKVVRDMLKLLLEHPSAHPPRVATPESARFETGSNAMVEAFKAAQHRKIASS